MKTQTEAADEITIASRTNNRDGLSYILQFTDGIPACPHCGTPMMRLGDQFENSACGCWWQGANEINYYAQVVVYATQESEDAWMERRAAEYHEAQAKQQAASDRHAARLSAATQAVVGKVLRGVKIELFEKFDGTKNPNIVRGVEGGQVIKGIGRHNMGGGNYQPTVIVESDGHDYFVFIRHLIEVAKRSLEIEQIEALSKVVAE